MLRTIPRPALLILLIPLCLYLSHVHANPVLVFVVTGISILGLISLMSKSTDQLSLSTGPVVGGLLNASFGNFPELLIGITAIRAGMFVLVKSSMVGSVLGNILFTLGLSMFSGGLKYPTQRFSKSGSSASVLMLSLTLLALMIPSFVHYAYRSEGLASVAAANTLCSKVSLAAALVLLPVYLSYLFFSLKTHASEFSKGGDSAETPVWGISFATAMLLVSATGVAYQSDLFVDSMQGMLAQSSVLSERFMGIIFVAAIGNAVGLGVALNMARQNKMDLAFQVSMGASIQVALFIVPLLVLYSFWLGKPLPLVFHGVEIIALWSCTMVGNSLLDGDSNWFEGLMFVAVYLLLAITFFFLP